MLDRERVTALAAEHLSSALGEGEGYDQTLPIYESLMTMVRDAREISQRTFSSNYVMEKAAAAGDVLVAVACLFTFSLAAATWAAHPYVYPAKGQTAEQRQRNNTSVTRGRCSRPASIPASRWSS